MLSGWAEMAGGLDWGERAVHRLRVTIRREQARLRAVRGALDANEAKRARRAWRRVMKAAGAVRNYDIAMRLLRRSGLAGLDSIAAECLKQRGALMLRLQKVVEETGRPVIAWPPVEPREDSSLRALDAFFAAGRAAERAPAPRRLHALRLTGKRLRYRLELAGPGPEIQPALERLKRLQDALGAINDCVTTRGLLGRGPFRDWLDAAVAGLTEEFQHEWDEGFKKEEPWRRLVEQVRSGSGDR
jgi:CHAD domain-containing protein